MFELYTSFYKFYENAVLYPENMLSFFYKVLLNCLFYILQLFGLFLPVEFVDLSLFQNKYWVLKQVHAVFMSILLIFSYSYLQWLGNQTIFKIQRTSNVILLVLTLTSFLFICLITILGTVFWNREKWSYYLKLQRILKSKMKVTLKRNSFYFCLEFLFGHFALIAVVSIDQWRHYLSDVSVITQILFIVLKDCLLYYIFLIAIIIYNAILLLRNYFHTLRIYLTSVVGLGEHGGSFSLYSPTEGIIAFPSTVLSEKTLVGLIEASKIFNMLAECVDIFNHLFGYVIMLINISTVLTILTALNTLLVSAETNKLTTEVVLDCLFEALLFLIWNSFILSASGLLKEESSQIVTLCIKLQHLMPQSSQERKELLNLAHQVKRKSLRVSASGFFDVDFYLILTLFTCVGTYIVVLVQFSHMDF